MNFPPGLALLQHHRRLTSRMAGRLGHSEAEDLASEAVARGINRPAPDGRQAPWIERIFQNLVADRGRRQMRRGGAAAPLPDDEAAASPATGAANPEEALLAEERRRALEQALPAIPPELRDAVVARYYDDRDYAELAAASGITEATARTRVHRAMARLRQALGRLAAIIPAPLGGGAHATASLLPAVLAAAVAVPAMTGTGETGGDLSRLASGRAPVTLAQAARRRGAPPVVVPVAPATTPVAVAPAPPTAVPASPRPAGSPTGVKHAGEAPPRAAADTAAVKRYDFDDDEVEGALHGPDDRIYSSIERQRFESLIEIPAEFISSTAKMVEDL